MLFENYLLYPRYHLKIVGDILKIIQKNKCIRLKMKNRSNICNINGPRPRHEQKWVTPKQYLKLNSWKNYATLRVSWKKGCLSKKRVVLNCSRFTYFRPFTHDIITHSISPIALQRIPPIASLGNGVRVEEESNKKS